MLKRLLHRHFWAPEGWEPMVGGTLNFSQERCQSGRMGRPAKALSVLKRTVGSNPTLSAMSLSRRLLTVALTVGALTFIAPSPAGAKVATGCVKTYTVKRNDSWSKIADKVSVSMRLLLQVNRANANTMILIGDVICLPRAAVTSSAPPRNLQLQPPAERYSTKQAAAIIREIFPDNLEVRAVAIAKRESRLNPAAFSWCCVGLFQLNWNPHKKWLNAMGIGSAQELLDPYVNARAALQLYRRSNGWGPWE